jgi:hypothetical protein
VACENWALVVRSHPGRKLAVGTEVFGIDRETCYAVVMPYVVKAVTTSGIAIWLTPQAAGQPRSISERLQADVFETRGDARRAIKAMPRVFADTGIRFTVEPTDADSYMAGA